MSATLVALAAAAAEGGQAKGGLPQLDTSHFAPQLIWLGLCFGALYLLLSRITLPRIATVIDERRARIARDLDEAARLKGETEKALAAYEQELAAARGKAHSMAREKRETLAQEVEAERGRVDAQVTAKLTDAEQRIAAMKERALAQVNAIANETAEAVVEKLVGPEVEGEEGQKVRGPLQRVAGE